MLQVAQTVPVARMELCFHYKETSTVLMLTRRALLIYEFMKPKLNGFAAACRSTLARRNSSQDIRVKPALTLVGYQINNVVTHFLAAADLSCTHQPLDNSRPLVPPQGSNEVTGAEWEEEEEEKNQALNRGWTQLCGATVL
ncbi:hypothetical protein DPEC_G00150720 [Dallia pectoralis]|uniref:Uncharacterized protein n=1 Tax=Dallia pectoralis TaxID=75939 RepID=A0ACC2GJP3_DALPE|nr:hypothetical protein DPEC_G00150720 [Dallia pectoralis]